MPQNIELTRRLIGTQTHTHIYSNNFDNIVSKFLNKTSVIHLKQVLYTYPTIATLKNQNQQWQISKTNRSNDQRPEKPTYTPL